MLASDDCPDRLGIMLKPSVLSGESKGLYCKSSILASGGAWAESASIKEDRSGPMALITTPSLVLVTSPETAKREASLKTKGRNPTPWTVPRTRISTPFFSDLGLVGEFDTGKNGRNQSFRLLHIVPDRQVDVNKGENHKPPHQQVMNIASHLLAAEYRHS